MRITYIAAGAGGSYCGACARDVALVRGLRARGHDVLMLPLYTPIRTEGPDPSEGQVFFGGINAYLEQHCWLFRKTPRWLDWLFDRPWLLRLVSRHAIETRPENLGPMTVSVLRGEDGFQRKELETLVQFLEAQAKPHVVNLTNALLSGLAPTIKERLEVPVVCTLQGEDSFVQRLGKPYRDEARALMRENARAIDRFVAPGAAYAADMGEFLAVDRQRIHVIRPGLDLASFGPAGTRHRGPFRVGYLSRVSPAKGLDVLVEAFCLLDRTSEAILAVAGELAPQNRRFWKEQNSCLRDAGLIDRLDYVSEIDPGGKVEFLKNCSVFCLPARYAEQRAIAVLEAMAAGVPVILPDRGVFPELIDLTGGGLLVPPDDAQALAEAVARLRDDPDEADRLGQAAASGIVQHFSAEEMTRQTLEVYEALVKS